MSHSYIIKLSQEDAGAILDVLDIRASQYRAMAEGSDPCEERHEVDYHEGMEMYEFYMDTLARFREEIGE